MTRVLRGIVHGKTIEVTEDLGMSDGQAVDLLVAPSGSLQPPPKAAVPARRPRSYRGHHPVGSPEFSSAGGIVGRGMDRRG